LDISKGDTDLGERPINTRTPLWKTKTSHSIQIIWPLTEKRATSKKVISEKYLDKGMKF
jgi:hypothetical protein